jgi:2-amino-4-hydroxy-6-hydroxymethyldihydropteridine diphosphokinase
MFLLGLGSNLSSSFGDRFENLNLAISYLETYQIKIINRSSFYETPSYPDIKNPKFINLVVDVSTYLLPEDLASVLIFVEEKLERKRIKKNEPRTCDIDIIDYDQKIIRNHNNQNLTLPHPKMHVRTFVLLPLFEITQQWMHPEKKIEIKKLINSLNIKDLRTIKQI